MDCLVSRESPDQHLPMADLESLECPESPDFADRKDLPVSTDFPV